MQWLSAGKSHPGLALLLPYCRRHVTSFFWGFWLLALTTATSTAIPYTMKLATDAIVHHPETTGQVAGGLVLLALLTAVLRLYSRTHVFRIGRAVEYALRRDYHHHLQQLDAGYYDRARTGDLVFRGSNDILAVRMFIGPGFMQLSNTVMAYGISLPVMIALDPWLTLVALSPYPLVLMVARWLTKRLYQRSRQAADRFGELTSFIQESLSGLAVLRNHAREEGCQGQFQEHLDHLYHSHAHHTRLQSLFNPLMMFSGAVSVLLILGYGGHQVARGVLTVGDFVAFSGYLALLIWPTIGFGWVLTVLQRGLAGLDRLQQVLNTPPAIDLRDPPPFAPWRGHLSVRNLNFSYPDDGKTPPRPVLAGLSLEIAPGSFIGLVGRVGSGKSALLHSLAALHPLPEGAIFLDGREIHTIPEGELRANLTLAPQESFLFSATVRDNLLYGHPAPDEAADWALADRVALTEEIRRFPRQMQTMVGERGITLSGGQRQRVALARALAVNAPILLLDDIFANVDARTEATILEKLLQHQQGQTVTIVMVCHRVAALHRAEVIHVLDHGRLIASGPHPQLLTACPLYRELHSRMRRAEALEALQEVC